MNRSNIDSTKVLRRLASWLIGACLFTSPSCGELEEPSDALAEAKAPSATHMQQATTELYQSNRAPRELCVADPKGAAVHVFDMTKAGDQPPLRSFGTHIAQINDPTAIALAEAHGEMLVAEGGTVRTFNIDDQGDVAPRRVLQVAAQHLAYDPSHDLLFAVVGGEVHAYPRDAAGATAPLWTLRTDPKDAPSTLAYDHVRNELLLVNKQSLTVFDWNATGGIPKYARTRPEYPSTYRHAAFDASSGEIYVLDERSFDTLVLRRFTRAPLGGTIDQRSAFDLDDDDVSGGNSALSLRGFGIDPEHGEAIIMMDDHNGVRLLVYDLATARFKYRIAGGHTGLAGDGCLAVNQARHEYTVGSQQSRSLLTFKRPQSGLSPHDLTPRRIGPPFGDGPLSVAADVARDELYLTARGDPAVHVLSISTGEELRRVIDPATPTPGSLLFDPASDRLFIKDYVTIRVYARPTADTMTPLRRYAAPPHRNFGDMALDAPNQRLFAFNFDATVAYDLRQASTDPVFSFVPAVNRGPFVPTGRPFPPPYRGVTRLFVHNDQLVAGVYDGSLAIFAMLGTPPVPTNPPIFRNLAVPLSGADQWLIDARRPSTLWVSRTAEEARVETYELGLFASPRPVRTISGPSTRLASTGPLTICR